MKKITLCVLSITLLASCGGGDSVAPLTPPVSDGGTGGNVTADYPIKTSSLVRYENGNYIEYSGNLKYRGNATYTPYDYSIKLRESYSLSAAPTIVDTIAGQQETITRTRIATAQTGEVKTDTSQVIQFKNMPDYGTTFYTYRESKPDTCTFIINNGCVGRLDLPGYYSLDLNYVSTGYESTWGLDLGLNGPKWNTEYEVTVSFSVEKKEVITTALGKFETYAVNFVLDKKDANPYFTETPFSISGKYWIHPAIGAVKAEYVQKEGEFDIYDISYSITKTNLVY